MADRIYLSPPHLDAGGREGRMVAAALQSNWVAPLGPDVDAFEQECAERCGRAAGAATSSGTAALHLALRLVGVGAGDEVLVPSLTFVASANAALYLGARPTLVDVDPATWTLDVALVRATLARRARQGRLPAAVVTVDLYGQCSDYDALTAVCADHGVPLVVDAAESLGADYGSRPAASAGDVAVLSFNGNKIITTSGGGMLLADDPSLVARARTLAAQAREPVVHYEHVELGYNYRLSNVLAALGRAQLAQLDDRVRRRRRVHEYYRQALAEVPGIGFMPTAAYGRPTWWLTCLTIDSTVTGVSPDDVRRELEGENVEARPAWKPLHLQPLFRDAAVVGGDVSARIFDSGLCVPSGSALREADLERIVGLILRALAGPRRLVATRPRSTADERRDAGPGTLDRDAGGT